MYIGGGCECASIPAEEESESSACVKKTFATNAIDNRGARASHHLMNEDGDLLLQGLFWGQKMQDHPEACGKLLLELLEL